MVIVTVMYPKTQDSRFDFDYYLQKHTPLVKERFHAFGLQGVRLMRGTITLDGALPAFEVLAELTFDSMEHLQEAMSRHGQEIVGDIPMFTNVKPAIQINDPM